MKIAFLADSFLLDESTGINGTQVQMYNLAEAFAHKRLDVHYISLTRGNKLKQENINGIKLYWIKSNYKIFSWLRDFICFKDILDNINPDVLYQRGRSHLTYIASRWSKKHNKKFIWGSNGEDSCDFWKGILRLNRSNRPFWKKIVLYPYFGIQDILIHKGIRNATCVVNQTEHQKAQLLRNYGKEGIVISSYFRLTDLNQKSKKEKLCIWVANLSPYKQPEIILKLAEHCISFNDWKFMIIGGTKDKNYLNNLVKEASKLSNVEMVGSVPFNQTDDYFSRASLFVSTSIIEADGISNAMIQALLNRIPILSLNHDPNDWIMKYNLGFCAKGNMEIFLSKGYSMLQDFEALTEIGRRCLEFAKNTFSSDTIIDRYIELFKGLPRK
jgi:glycosyltransferase involved in cell wall biosynthesis